MAPIAASLSALVSTVSALSSTKFAMIPVAAGLAIGTAVGVTYSSSEAPAEPAKAVVASVAPAPVVAPPVPDTKPAAPVTAIKAGTPCEAQTWPYIEAKCRVGQADSDRKVRLVTAPRASDIPTEAQQSSDIARRENPGLVSSSTVLHTSQPLAEEPKVTKRSAKRQARRTRRTAEQAYQVPSEYGRGNARIVVRPMRIDPYR